MDCCKTKNEDKCCKDLKKKSDLNQSEEFSTKLKGGKRKMNTKITLWVAIGVLFLIALFLVFKVGAGNAETVSTAGSAAKTVASNMVGGC